MLISMQVIIWQLISLETLVTIAMISVLLLFYELGQGWHKIYFLEYDHPHELIRVAYIVYAK